MDKTFKRYDPVAVTLHWLIALCILTLIPLGYFLDSFPMTIRFDAYILHKSLGISVLTLSVLRLVWRLMNPPPPFPDHMKPWEKIIAKATHWFFYFLIIAMPLSGWLMVSANHKYPTVFFWMGEVPFIPMPEGIDPKATHEQFETIHAYLAYGAAVLIVLHIAAALKHHFIDRDLVLRRMLPRFLQRKF